MTSHTGRTILHCDGHDHSSRSWVGLRAKRYLASWLLTLAFRASQQHLNSKPKVEPDFSRMLWGARPCTGQRMAKRRFFISSTPSFRASFSTFLKNSSLVTFRPGCLRIRVQNPFHFTFSFLRSAQYFFIRTLTAFFAAADILERLRRRCFFAGLGSAFQRNGLSPLQAPRLGNCRRIPAISAWSC
jgi:hypothetical protein